MIFIIKDSRLWIQKEVKILELLQILFSCSCNEKGNGTTGRCKDEVT